MSCSHSFASARSTTELSSSSVHSKPAQSFFEELSFLLLQFMVQEGESAAPVDTTSPSRDSDRPIAPAVVSLQAVLHAAQPPEEQDDELTSLSLSASAELFLLRLKHLLERRVHEKQAAVLAQRLRCAVDNDMRGPPSLPFPSPPPAVCPARPTSPASSQSRRRRPSHDTSSLSIESHRDATQTRTQSREDAACVDGRAACRDAPLLRVSAQSGSGSEARCTGALCTSDSATTVYQCHGDLLLRLQRHLCESMTRAEDGKTEYGGFGGVIFPEDATVLQRELVGGVESVLAQCSEDARSAPGSSLTERLRRELDATRSRLTEVCREDGRCLTVHEVGKRHLSDNASGVGGGEGGAADVDDDAVAVVCEGLRGRFGQCGGDFVQHAVQQHLWLLLRMLRQRFTAYNGWSLLEQAYRAVTMPSKSPSPVAPTDQEAATHKSDNRCGAQLIGTTEQAGREGVREGHERPFTTPSPPGPDSADASTPLRPPPLVVHTQTKRRSPLPDSAPPLSCSAAPSEDPLPACRARRETQKPATDGAATEVSELCALASLLHKLPGCPAYDALLRDLRVTSASKNQEHEGVKKRRNQNEKIASSFAVHLDF